MAFQAEKNDQLLISDQADGVMTLTINRPEKRNAITYAMWCDLKRRIDALETEPSVRAVVIRGAGRDFSAGADIAEFDAARRDAATARDYEAANSAAFAAIRNAQIPVIAAIRGICFGGGFGIAAACDLRIATPDSVFSVPAARLGLAYPQDAMTDIIGSVGAQMARYLTFSAERIDAQTALRTGFLLEVVSADALDDRVSELARVIAENAPLSVRASKAAIHAALSGDAAAAVRSKALGALTFDSMDYAEGRAAFRERRKPMFKGE